MPQIHNSEMYELIGSVFQRSNDSTLAYSKLHGMFMGLPALRAYWPMSVIGNSGQAIDMSTLGRTLTRNGNPLVRMMDNGLSSYYNLDGTGDYLSVADAAPYDITGTETFVHSSIQGLTIGGWFRIDNITSTDKGLAGKWNTNTNQGSYLLFYDVSETAVSFAISSNGTSSVVAASSVSITTQTWYWIVGRFIPSTEVAVFVNKTKDTNTTSVPASVYSGSADFMIGNWVDSGPTNREFDGGVAHVFLCPAALSDAQIRALYEASRPLVAPV